MPDRFRQEDDPGRIRRICIPKFTESCPDLKPKPQGARRPSAAGENPAVRRENLTVRFQSAGTNQNPTDREPVEAGFINLLTDSDKSCG